MPLDSAIRDFAKMNNLFHMGPMGLMEMTENTEKPEVYKDRTSSPRR